MLKRNWKQKRRCFQCNYLKYSKIETWRHFSTYKIWIGDCVNSPEVSNSLTPVSKNYTLRRCKETDKTLINKQIKVWHGICSTISENEWLRFNHERNVSYFNGKTRELRCETRLPYTKKPRNNNNKNTIDIWNNFIMSFRHYYMAEMPMWLKSSPSDWDWWWASCYFRELPTSRALILASRSMRIFISYG